MITDLNRWNGILSSPSPEALKSPNGIRVFKNSLLEKVIARAHWTVPGLWVLPLATYFCVKSVDILSVEQTAALVLSGILCWSLLEYGIHKYLFHFRITPEMNPALKKTIFTLHGYHHEYPNDPGRLVMPIALSWPLGSLLGLFFWGTLGTTLFFPVFSGVMLGYLSYDWVHYYSHHGRPTTRVGKYLHKFHAIHHFIDENQNFGISSPVWDWIWGTAQEPKTPQGTSSKLSH